MINVKVGDKLLPKELEILAKSVNGELFAPLSPKAKMTETITVLLSASYECIFVETGELVEHTMRDGKVIQVTVNECKYIKKI